MLPHPFYSSRKTLAVVIAYTVATALLPGGLFVLYGGLPLVAAFADALIFVSLLAACGVLNWFFLAYLRAWQAQFVVMLAVILFCCSLCYAAVSLFELEDGTTFMKLLPLRILIGASGWIIQMQWYHLQMYKNEQREKEEKTAPPPPATEPVEWLDRISVKDTGRIHIIPLKDVLYIQASGDYVTLFTPTGQYVKESSMKYFDTHLPATTFVRIHRSTIVNTDHILRIELFEKTSYNIRLKNGVNLRASLTDYRLLKERLDL
jgi:hypothetical protein